jgi:hypothetical protein
MVPELNDDCLQRIVRFCLEPLYKPDGTTRKRRVAQPRLARLMQVSKVCGAIPLSPESALIG